MNARTDTPTATHQLHFADLAREVPGVASDSIFQTARRHGVRIVGACGGRGTCGSCMVRVTEGDVSVQASHADDADAPPAGDHHAPSRRKWVRACQAHAVSDCTIEIAPRSLAPVVRAEADTRDAPALVLDTDIHAHDVALAPASLSDPRADAQRLRDAVPVPDADIEWRTAAQLSTELRRHDWRLRTYWRGPTCIGMTVTGARALGLALDLGSTNAAGFLIDLEDGRHLASLGLENPQVAWGGDVISRVNHALREGERGSTELREAAQRVIVALAHDLTRSAGAELSQIVEVSLCGNTAMHHLLLGLPVGQLARAPFVASVSDSLTLPTRDLGLPFAPGAQVQVAPGIGGFVGGDHVAALLATQAQWSACGTSLLMDIGTNTEITLVHQGQLYTASSPSGPALEGGHISCGMRAALGAIERVHWHDGSPSVQTIGDEEAVGLCGSGVLDALAVLHQGGVIDARGRILAGHASVETRNGQRAVRLAPEVFVTQDDVRAVQLAKSAIRSVTELLARVAGVDTAQLERVIIAGSFGAYISVESAIAIGLLPRLPRERFVQVGNAAGLGVRQMLASRAARAQARELAARCHYQELASRADFQKTFLNFIGYPKD